MKLVNVGGVFLLIGALCTQAMASESMPHVHPEFIPQGMVVQQVMSGQLNGDRIEDVVYLVKGSDPALVLEDEELGPLDQNRRGLVVLLSNAKGSFDAHEYLARFASEFEDGGVYVAPELDIELHDGQLQLHFGHGRYGYWSYTFRFHQGDFELVNYEASESNGPVVLKTQRVNFLNQQLITQVNIHADDPQADEEFEETLVQLKPMPPFKLRDIENFESFSLVSYLEAL